jgi:hypothetical protein
MRLASWEEFPEKTFAVMAGLVPAIHELVLRTWMPGTSPGMTKRD